MVIALVAIPLIATGHLNLGSNNPRNAYLWIVLIKTVSTLGSMIHMQVFARNIMKTEPMKKIGLKAKFNSIFFSILVTKLQEPLISLFVLTGGVADTDEYSNAEIVWFTDNLLMCF